MRRSWVGDKSFPEVSPGTATGSRSGVIFKKEEIGEEGWLHFRKAGSVGAFRRSDLEDVHLQSRSEDGIEFRHEESFGMFDFKYIDYFVIEGCRPMIL